MSLWSVEGGSLLLSVVSLDDGLRRSLNSLGSDSALHKQSGYNQTSTISTRVPKVPLTICYILNNKRYIECLKFISTTLA